MTHIYKWAFGGIALASLSLTLWNNHYNWMNVENIAKSRESINQNVSKLDRGTQLSDEVTPEELYNAYQKVRDEYHEKAFQCNHKGDTYVKYSQLKSKQSTQSYPCSETWKTLRETEDGIQVSKLNHPEDPSSPYVRMSAIMPGSVQTNWNFLGMDTWNTTMPKLDPFYDGLEVKKRYSYHKHKLLGLKHFHPIDMLLGRKKYTRLGTFGKRDFTFVQVTDIPRKDGLWISGTVTVISESLFPRVKGYTRAYQNSIAFYEELKPKPFTNPNDTNHLEIQTKVTVIGKMDLNDSSEDGIGGNIPMWLYIKTVGRTGVFFCRNMRKELQRQINSIEPKEKIKKHFYDPNVEANVDNTISLFSSLFFKLKKKS